MVESSVQAQTVLLKDQLDEQAVYALAEIFSANTAAFNQHLFFEMVLPTLTRLTLKRRVNLIVEALHAAMPPQPVVFDVLTRIAENWLCNGTAGWQSFMAWPVIDYAGEWGITKPHQGLALLAKLTPLFTAEFAIRAYLDRHFELTCQQMLDWTNHADEHVRRLACEGLRPRLPWARHVAKLSQTPDVIFQVLERLKDDPSRYVQKSVANNLNDLSKLYPDRVIECCQRWQQEELASSQRLWIVRHALRTLIKSGHPEVFKLLGMSSDITRIKVVFSVDKTCVEMGETLTLNAIISSCSVEPANLLIDYRVWHMKANGQQRAKVFKWKTLSLLPEHTVSLQKKHVFKQLTSRRYYPGQQRFELMINGQPVDQISLELQL